MSLPPEASPAASAPPPRPRAGPRVLIGSVLFVVWMYGLMALQGILCLPLMLGPRRWTLAAVRVWTRLVLGGLRVLCGVTVEVRGREHVPSGPCLVAAKHQGMIDIMPPLLLLRDPAMILKKELMRLPFFGWYTARLQMIPIDREAHAKALRALLAAARDRASAGREVFIFPEGTRRPPGAAPDYKPGVAALYRELELPCTPVATNSGLSWPAHGLVRYPGAIVFEYLPAIPPGLKRAEFMRTLESAIETASARLAAERR